MNEFVEIAIGGLGRPPTSNLFRQLGNPMSHASVIKKWRSQAAKHWEAAMDATGFAFTTPVHITVAPLHKDRRSPQDVGACAPAAKAAIDGARDAGLLPDDDKRFVHSITFQVPEVCGEDGLRVRIETI